MDVQHVRTAVGWIGRAHTQAMREEFKSGQAEMKSTVNAFQKKMDACLETQRMPEKR
jgi:hypothetical protein